MAELTSRGRKQIKPSNFAIPASQSDTGAAKYPIQDAAHARNALSRVAQNGTPAEKAKVRAAVARKYPGIEQSNPPKGKGK
jgi:hypothetical protein